MPHPNTMIALLALAYTLTACPRGIDGFEDEAFGDDATESTDTTDDTTDDTTESTTFFDTDDTTESTDTTDDDTTESTDTTDDTTDDGSDDAGTAGWCCSCTETSCTLTEAADCDAEWYPVDECEIDPASQIDCGLECTTGWCCSCDDPECTLTEATDCDAEWYPVDECDLSEPRCGLECTLTGCTACCGDEPPIPWNQGELACEVDYAAATGCQTIWSPLCEWVDGALVCPDEC